MNTDNNKQSKPQNNSKALVQAQYYRSGPIPTPEEMQGYKQIRDNLPDRIMTMAEKEQDNSFTLRNKIIEGRVEIQRKDAVYDMVALCFCSVLCLIFILAALFLFYNDKNGAAAFFCFSAFVTLPKTYLKPREKKSENKQEK